MIDAILYISHALSLPDSEKLTAILDGPKAVNAAGDRLYYVRVHEDTLEAMRGFVLVEETYTGKGTGDRLYQKIKNDAETLAIYTSVYTPPPYEDDEDLETTETFAPAFKFGQLGEANISWYVEVTLDDARAAKIAEINAAYTEQVHPLIKDYPEPEQQTWVAQDVEARAYLAWYDSQQGNAPATPVLDSILMGRNGENGIETLQELCLAVQSNAQRFTQAQQLTGKRQRLVKHARDAETLEAIDAIKW